jgi:DNA-directed RNA polymerase subunit RPC12/RpoP
MNALTSPSRNDPSDDRSPPKALLFCPDCGRSAPVGQWARDAAEDAETLRCPDCGATLAVRPRSDESV